MSSTPKVTFNSWGSPKYVASMFATVCMVSNLAFVERLFQTSSLKLSTVSILFDIVHLLSFVGISGSVEAVKIEPRNKILILSERIIAANETETSVLVPKRQCEILFLKIFFRFLLVAMRWNKIIKVYIIDSNRETEIITYHQIGILLIYEISIYTPKGRLRFVIRLKMFLRWFQVIITPKVMLNKNIAHRTANEALRVKDQTHLNNMFLNHIIDTME